MKVMIVGGGGREHALAWKLSRDDPSLELIAAPGNPGIARLARCVPISVDKQKELANLAEDEYVDLTIVGPEQPLRRPAFDYRPKLLRFSLAGGPNRRRSNRAPAHSTAVANHT